MPVSGRILLPPFFLSSPVEIAIGAYTWFVDAIVTLVERQLPAWRAAPAVTRP